MCRTPRYIPITLFVPVLKDDTCVCESSFTNSYNYGAAGSIRALKIVVKVYLLFLQGAVPGLSPRPAWLVDVLTSLLQRAAELGVMPGEGAGGEAAHAGKKAGPDAAAWPPLFDKLFEVRAACLFDILGHRC